jgi:uncharacterized protein YciI
VTDTIGFLFRLLPPRPDFAFTMSEEERQAMLAHVEYWTGLAKAGSVAAFGPVADHAGPYGIGIVLAHDLAAAEALRDQDPVMTRLPGFRTEIMTMVQLVTPDHIYSAV